MVFMVILFDMTLLRHTFSGTTFAKVADSGDLKEALDDPWMEYETIIGSPTGCPQSLGAS